MRFYGRVEHDLASSGMTAVPIAELGPVPDLDDVGAWGRLRAKIAAYNGVPASEVLPSFGTTHALWTAYASLLCPGGEVLVERPTYEPMYRIAEGLGARVIHFDRPAGEGFRSIPSASPPRSPRARASSRSRTCTTPAASAPPTRAFAPWPCSRPSTARTSWSTRCTPPSTRCATRAARGEGRRGGSAPNVVAVSSLTKVYGLGDHRIGWMLASPEVIARGEDAQTCNIGHHAALLGRARCRRLRSPPAPRGSCARSSREQARARGVVGPVATAPHLDPTARGPLRLRARRPRRGSHGAHRTRRARRGRARRARFLLRRAERVSPLVVDRRREAGRGAGEARARAGLGSDRGHSCTGAGGIAFFRVATIPTPTTISTAAPSILPVTACLSCTHASKRREHRLHVVVDRHERRALAPERPRVAEVSDDRGHHQDVRDELPARALHVGSSAGDERQTERREDRGPPGEDPRHHR